MQHLLGTPLLPSPCPRPVLSVQSAVTSDALTIPALGTWASVPHSCFHMFSPDGLSVCLWATAGPRWGRTVPTRVSAQVRACPEPELGGCKARGPPGKAGSLLPTVSDPRSPACTGAGRGHVKSSVASVPQVRLCPHGLSVGGPHTCGR